jgi:hypothetical protein
VKWRDVIDIEVDGRVILKVGLEETVFEIVYRIHVIQDKVKRRFHVNKFRVS